MRGWHQVAAANLAKKPLVDGHLQMACLVQPAPKHERAHRPPGSLLRKKAAPIDKRSALYRLALFAAIVSIGEALHGHHRISNISTELLRGLVCDLGRIGLVG